MEAPASSNKAMGNFLLSSSLDRECIDIQEKKEASKETLGQLSGQLMFSLFTHIESTRRYEVNHSVASW